MMMSPARIRGPSLLLGLVLAAGIGVGCNGPTGVLPGGALSGGVALAPSDWSAVLDYGTCQLETRPADPYSVNIVCTVVEDSVYLNAGNTETKWAVNIAADPAVRVRIDGTLYEMTAERVADDAEIAAFGDAWISQSSFRRDPTELDGEVWIYRLVSR
jgi:hypothetical protein